MVLSQVIVDLQPGKPPRDDIEIYNTSAERLYVVIEPAEILKPGTRDEQRLEKSDPERLGLLVTPNRMILEPGQRKLLRIAAIAARAATDRIYRVAVKPVAGTVEDASALKVMIGFDVLVVLRPEIMRPKLVTSRTGRQWRVENRGNTNVELVDGRQCEGSTSHCVDLPGRRLYPGTSWEHTLPLSIDPIYYVKTGSGVERLRP